MIFLDANVFLRYLGTPATAQDLRNQEIAAQLFADAESGLIEVTTSEPILAEITFILSSKRHYGLEAAEIATYLAPILRLPAFKMPRGRKRIVLRAFEIWCERPKLEFVDAHVAAALEGSEILLATFDSDFDGLPNVTHWRPT